MQIDQTTFGRVTPRSVPQVMAESQRAPRKRRKPAAFSANSHSSTLGEIRIGLGSCCQAQGSAHVHEEILSVIQEAGVPASVKSVGCIGMCHQTPLMELVIPGGEPKFFSHVQPEDVRNIVLRHFQPRSLLRRVGHRFSRWLDVLYSNEEEDAAESHALDVREQPVCAFLGPQKHIATEFCGDIDPLDLDEYLRHHGFQGLQHCLNELSADRIIDEVRVSGLRGRGGAGFPTHIKWQKAREASADIKYVICNGDEGDPGAFMDRMLLESFPYRVIEGMAIAARAVGAREAIFYIRAEYPLAVKRIREAIRRCEAARFCRQGIVRYRLRTELPRHGRGWSVHLRGRNGADQLHGRTARYTEPAAAVSSGERTVGPSHVDQ